MRKEDADDDDDDEPDEDEPRNGFRMADEEVLRDRKIVKAVRRSGASSQQEPVASTAGVFGSAFGASFAASAPAKPNPFATINLFAPASAPVAVPVSVPAPAAAPILSTAHSSDESEYKKKMRKLNQSLLSWMDKQITEHPALVWKEGIQDYLKYCMSLAEKYPEGKSSDGNVSAMSSNAKTLLHSMPSDANAANPFSSSGSNVFSTKPPVAETAAKPTTAFDFSVKAKEPAAAPFAFGALAPAAAPAAPFSFSFSGSTAAAPAPLPAFSPVFSATPAAAAFPSAAFSFGGSAPASSSAAPNIFGAPQGLPPVGGGLFGGAPKAAVAAADDDGDGGDDEGEPIMAPEKVLKNDQDTDDILHDVPCKLFRFSTEQKEWMDLGKGNLRVTCDVNSKKQRILIRNTMGKIAFNAFFFKGMKFDRLDKNKGLRFTAVTDPAVGPQGFMLRLKEEHVDDTLAKLEAGVASLS